MTDTLAPADYLADHFEQFTAELLEFLSLPSISALPDHAPHVAAAADWVAARLRQAGVTTVEVMNAGGVPTVYDGIMIFDVAPARDNLSRSWTGHITTRN